MAAQRAGLKTIILCRENEKHVEDIEADYIAGVNFRYVDRMEEVLEIALGKLVPFVRPEAAPAPSAG